MAINFENIDYLKTGNEKQQAAYAVLTSNAVFENLQNFQPLLVGTIPIRIDTENSDLDIICYWTDKNLFIEILIENFSHHRDFLLAEKKINNRETILATFRIADFLFEIFGQNRPAKEQEAYRHMIVEYKILQQQPESFRHKIIQLKTDGLTTEEAFAKQLGLSGDPYVELLTLESGA